MSERTILLVEDNPDDVDLTLMAFQQTKILNPVQIARDGVEALEYLFGEGAHAGRDLTAMPAIILLDVKLPKVDGLEVLRQIRHDPRTALIPVIILTSSTEESDVRSAYSLGCNSYVRKPIDFARFVEATRQIGLYWLLLNEPIPRS